MILFKLPGQLFHTFQAVTLCAAYVLCSQKGIALCRFRNGEHGSWSHWRNKTSSFTKIFWRSQIIIDFIDEEKRNTPNRTLMKKSVFSKIVH